MRHMRDGGRTPALWPNSLHDASVHCGAVRRVARVGAERAAERRGRLRRVRDARVRIDGADVSILAAGGSQIDLLRAGAHAIWDTGRQIFGFRVPDRLYADPFPRP